MLHITRRMLAGPLLAAAIGAGLLAAPAPALAAGVSGTVQVNDYLMVRSGPSLSARSVGTVRKGQKVAIQCVVSGSTVRGSVRTTNLWDRLGSGRYISHAYVTAGSGLRRCSAGPVQDQQTKTTSSIFTPAVVRSTDGRVNVRSGPSLSDALIGSFANGTRVNLVCGVVGDQVSGTVRATNAWAKLSNGYYMSYAYLKSGRLSLCPASSKPTSSMTPSEFIAAAVPGAQLGWRQHGVPPSVTIAQAILESGWGKSSLASKDYNFFGIKCFNGYYGKYATGCKTYRTTECTKAGSCYSTSATFRSYPSMARSFSDHGYFLRSNSRYKPAFSYTRDANKFIWNVWKAGYATDPNYYTKVTGLMSKYNLYKYDTWK
ncbi:sporangiospore maturation cell wall hydrolase GsmA [Mangrovihabitans endophyticus]|uniref:Flagellar protein FlgJ n=1 Tax=Mangrovihabitans endophyticus TaxID=1751298 RepID=A0A8J3FRM6_9ACTN|nr:sporangiospore maturation cell wall hydrolase GsmA [Mangrovihabitans endophyticus]GGL17408.1 hypothetical protein GCM10012284_59940 [Mangrovihabitans endophyticus]